MRSSVVPSVAFALLALVGAGPPARADERADWDTRYDVEFVRRAGETPFARVRAELRWGGAAEACPETVEIAMVEDGFPGGYGAHVADFEWVPGPDGPTARIHGARTLSRRAGRWELRPYGGRTAFRYVVSLDHDAAGWGSGPDEAPYAFEDGAFWTGRALFAVPSSARVALTLTAGEGERVSTSYDPAEGGVGRFDVADAERLVNAFVVVGRHRVDEVRVGEVAVTLTSSARVGAGVAHLRESIESFLHAATGLFGAAPPGRVLVAAHVEPAWSPQGGVFGRDVSLFLARPPGPGDAGEWAPFLSHELFHLWNGTRLAFADPDRAYWFTEGLTDYYARLLLVRSGRLTEEAFLAALAGAARRYLAAAGSSGLAEAGVDKFAERAMVYDGGCLAAFCLDVALRHESGGERTLDAVLRDLWFRCEGGSRLRREDLAEALGAQSRFLDEHVDGAALLPLDEAFRRIGAVMVLDATAAPPLEWLCDAVLRCPSMTSHGRGVVVDRSERAPLLPKDVIVALNGRAVADFDQLREAFATAQPGADAQVVVLRDGRPVQLAVAFPEGGTPPDGRIVRDVRVEIDPAAPPAAVALRSALLAPR